MTDLWMNGTASVSLIPYRSDGFCAEKLYCFEQSWAEAHDVFYRLVLFLAGSAKTRVRETHQVELFFEVVASYNVRHDTKCLPIKMKQVAKLF